LVLIVLVTENLLIYMNHSEIWSSLGPSGLSSFVQTSLTFAVFFIFETSVWWGCSHCLCQNSKLYCRHWEAFQYV